jgi:hypothetical protein
MVTFSQSRADLEAQVRKAFNFRVERRELFGPSGEQTGFYGLFRSDTNEIVAPSSVSDRYAPHQTEDVLRLFDATWEAFDGVANVSCHFNRGHYLSITPDKATRLNVYGTTDGIFPRLVIKAGYNGKPFSLEMGWYRDMCRNLARMTSVAGTSTSIRHTLSLEGKITDVIESFEQVRESWQALGDRVRAFESIRVEVPQFVAEVFGEPGESSVAQGHAQRRLDSIAGRILRERVASGRGNGQSLTATGWEAFNGVQGYIQHDVRRNSKPSQWDRMLLALDDPHVSKAEQVLLALAG